MTEDFIVGVVTGLGWGLFIGGPLGMLFILRLLRDAGGDDDSDDDGDAETPRRDVAPVLG